MKCSKCNKKLTKKNNWSCISGYDERGKHKYFLCEDCSKEWEAEHPKIAPEDNSEENKGNDDLLF